MNDAAGNGEVREIAEAFLCLDQSGKRGGLIELLAVEVQLQRADAGDDVDHAGERQAFEFDHQRVDADAQLDIEDDLAVFDEDVAVALLAVDRARAALGFGRFREDRREMRDGAIRYRPGQRALGEQSLLVGIGGSGIRDSDRGEAQAITRHKLAELPAVCRNDHEGADKAAERGAVGAKNDRHVPGEIDRADGVGVVVDVGRMEPRLAAVLARPIGLGADQADAGAVGIVVHLPFGGDDHRDVAFGEEIGCAVGAIEDAQGPFAAQRGQRGGG